MIVRIEYEGGRTTLCDAAVIGACYREHVGPSPKTAEVADRDLQRALGRTEVPGTCRGRAGEAARAREGKGRRGWRPQGQGRLG